MPEYIVVLQSGNYFVRVRTSGGELHPVSGESRLAAFRFPNRESARQVAGTFGGRVEPY